MTVTEFVTLLWFHSFGPFIALVGKMEWHRCHGSTGVLSMGKSASFE
jgi:hypothetical protein